MNKKKDLSHLIVDKYDTDYKDNHDEAIDFNALWMDFTEILNMGYKSTTNSIASILIALMKNQKLH